MVQGASLLNKTPMPVQSQVKTPETPAAISVAQVLENEEPPKKKSFIQRLIDKIVQKRMESLEKTPIEKLSESQRAELEANRKAENPFGYSV